MTKHHGHTDVYSRVYTESLERRDNEILIGIPRRCSKMQADSNNYLNMMDRLQVRDVR